MTIVAGDGGANNGGKLSVVWTILFGNLAIFGLVFGAQWATQWISASPLFTLPIWLPTTLVFFLLIVDRRPMRWWPGVAVAYAISGLSFHLHLKAIGVPVTWVWYAAIVTAQILMVAIGSTVCRSKLGAVTCFDGHRRAFKLAVSGALLPTALAPVVGSVLMMTANEGSAVLYMRMWGLWWLRDFAAVLVCLPVAYIWMHRAQVRGQPLIRLYFVPLALAVVAFILVFSTIRKQENAILRNHFEQVAIRFGDAFVASYQQYERVLQQTAQSLDGEGPLQLGEIRQRLSTVATIYPEVFGVALAIEVPRSGQGLVETALAGLYNEPITFGRFSVEGDAQRYFPIIINEPLKNNRLTLGQDLLSQRQLRELVLAAPRTGRTGATPPVLLEQGAGSALGLVLYYPLQFEQRVYSEGVALPVGPQAALGLVFLAEPFLGASWANFSVDGLEVEWMDMTNPGEAKPLARIGDIQREAEPARTARPIFEHVLQFEFIGRTWRLAVTASGAYAAGQRSIAAQTFHIIGVFFIGLLGYYLVSLFRRTALIEELVAERTAELQRAKESAEAAYRAKNEFLAVANHELRTPLNGILATADLLAESGLRGASLGLAKMIRDSGQILHGLISNLLDFARMDSGRVTVEAKPIALLSWAHSYHRMFLAQAEHKGLQLELVIGADVESGVEVVGDAARLGQVVINLVGNALKFTDHGTVRFGVDWRPLDERRGRLRLLVEDTGPGIDPAVAESLFSPFVQGDMAAGRRHEGAGLGLAIVQQLVQLMDGHIFVSGEPGRGSVFACYFELESAVAPQTGAAATQEDLGIAEVLAFEPTVLVVEDTSINRKVVALLLEKIGCRCLMASDAAECLRIMAGGDRVDAILMDCYLPGMDGFEATRRIKAMPDRAAVPVIALTANTTEDNRDRCYAAGMVDFLIKPLRAAELRAVLIRHIRPQTSGV
jgi:two-component system, sensor histidine kinase